MFRLLISPSNGIGINLNKKGCPIQTAFKILLKQILQAGKFCLNFFTFVQHIKSGVNFFQ